jgi:hypothetical protein
MDEGLYRIVRKFIASEESGQQSILLRFSTSTKRHQEPHPIPTYKKLITHNVPDLFSRWSEALFMKTKQGADLITCLCEMIHESYIFLHCLNFFHVTERQKAIRLRLKGTEYISYDYCKTTRKFFFPVSSTREWFI